MSTDAPAIASPELVLVRYGELALKGGNRKSFERALMRNIREVVEPIWFCFRAMAMLRVANRVSIQHRHHAWVWAVRV